MRVIAVANHKGGVGKTAVTHALGVLLSSEHGRRVLLCDLDPQASLTGACGIGDAGGRSLAEVINGAQAGTMALAEVLQPLGERLELAPGDIALASCELGLVARMGRESVLKRALAAVASAYDVAILDCPPSLGLLTINALNAAHGVLIPTQAEVQALRGLALFWQSLATVREALNPELEVIGVVPTFFDGRLVHHREALEAMHAGGLPALDVTIGRSVRVAESAAGGESVVTYDASGKRTAELRALTEVVREWLDGARA